MSITNLNEIPSDAFRAVLNISPEQRDFIHKYMECSDEVQSVVRSMFAVIDSEHTMDHDRHRAFATIADALHLKPENGHGSYGLDFRKSQAEVATKHPDPAWRPIIADRQRQMESQEATFADRVKAILQQKNITQEDLAERIDCTQSAVSKMLSRKSRPQRKTILKMATALNVEPTELWPDLEVTAILDSTAEFFNDRELTAAQAEALDAAISRPPAQVRTRELPSRAGR
ncbi:helix-turn-helix protein [Novipirellula galeiformis]|uniref:Helix-turn-helix protein n=1 Tax=Novipirellula galeiformis TaxID=2528004 RepID=A0A5C6CCA2_9BACT|nr:helix-turn-helix transcriptional regulator [Novipirellula galeiformis]TWU21722.1 helix-turn-helix protein [Novipirellula galeiformis]